MAVEIERKFLVLSDAWRKQATRSAAYQQGYLNALNKCSVRVRIAGDRGYLNIKSATLGVKRDEFEYEIPLDDARHMLDNLCVGSIVEKVRYFVANGELTWEIDEFTGNNAGLVVAEIELNAVDQEFERPAWVGEEVSHDPRYYNLNLVTHPYKDW